MLDRLSLIEQLSEFIHSRCIIFCKIMFFMWVVGQSVKLRGRPRFSGYDQLPVVLPDPAVSHAQLWLSQFDTVVQVDFPINFVTIKWL